MCGQNVLVVVRWILVVSGLLLALLNPVVLGELKVQVGLILTLAVANFFLHVQLVRKQPSLPWVAYLASAVDVLAITLMVMTSGRGASSLYVFYFSGAVRDLRRVPAERGSGVVRGGHRHVQPDGIHVHGRWRRRICRGQDSNDGGGGGLWGWCTGRSKATADMSRTRSRSAPASEPRLRISTSARSRRTGRAGSSSVRGRC